MDPTPTKRAVIDPLRRCPLNCLMCYYRFGDRTMVRPLEEVKRDVDAAVERGNVACDITGGEPLVYPDIVELAAYCIARGLRPRVITSGIGDEKSRDALIDMGDVRFLLSIHGVGTTHDWIVSFAGAGALLARIGHLLYGRAVDINIVVTRLNQSELAILARHLVCRPCPGVINFINFNPHHEWKGHPEALSLVSDMDVVEPELQQAAVVLESNGVGVNFRYFPMCRVADQFRHCVCNDLHVPFDSGEWDYDIQPKTFETHRAWGIATSEATEERGEPCCRCSVQDVCGGANRYWHAMAKTAYGKEPLRRQMTPQLGPDDFYFYRKHNDRGMAPY